MSTTDDQFATVVRGLSLTPGQAAEAEAVFASPETREMPRELIRRAVLTEYQARMILAGRGAELIVGRYVLLDELGEGGMGQVFKARDTAMDRPVALKLIRSSLLASEPAARRFQQEVKAVARLAHPNIVRAYDTGTAGAQHFLVTELVTGYDLARELARRGAFPPGEACEYARQTAIGLQHAFDNGLTHRDIKPSNLLYSTAERAVKIADFGLARLGSSSPGGLTADGSVFGTPDYIAPEQASSATAADVRSDLYSLGCSLYHLLTGQVPFPADTALAKLVAHAAQEPEPLEDVCPGLNPALVAVVRKLMAKNPADRYQAPLEAADALAPFCPKLRGGGGAPGPRSISASAPVLLGSAPAVPSTFPASSLPTQQLPTAPAPHPTVSTQQQARSRRGLIYAALAALAVVAVAAASVTIVWLQQRPKQSDETSAQNGPHSGAPLTQNPNVTVTVPIDDWALAKQPGVAIHLGDRIVTAEQLAKPFELPPGRYTLVARKDNQDLEARVFEVTPEKFGSAAATRPAVIPDPNADPGEVSRWGATGAVTDVVYLPNGAGFVTAEVPKGNPFAGADELIRTVGARYSVDQREVTLQWKTLLAFRIAVFPRVSRAGAISFLDHDGFRTTFSLDTDPYHFKLFDDQTGQVAGQADTDLRGWKNRVPLLVAAPDGSRVLFTTTGREPELKPSGVIRVQAVEASPEGVFKLTESNRFPGDTACFDPTGRRVLTASNRTLTLYSEETGKPASAGFTGPTADVTCVAMASDGKRIAACDKSGAVFVWNVGAKEPLATGRGHTGKANAIGFTLDNTRLITAGDDGTVRVWSATTGKELRQYRHGDGKPVYALAVSPGGKRVLTGGADKTIRLWQLPP